jgi:transposase
MPSPVAVGVELSVQERAQLESWARRRTSAQALAQRSRIVLLAADGLTNTQIAERLAIKRGTAARWRSRFASDRLDGLVDAPRLGRPRTISDEQVEQVIIKTLESTPKDATHWSTRSMAREGRAHAVGGTADLEGVRPAAPPPGDLEAVQGPAVHRQSARCGRALSEPARARGRAVRR